jgi:hypothetical protein
MRLFYALSLATPIKVSAASTAAGNRRTKYAARHPVDEGGGSSREISVKQPACADNLWDNCLVPVIQEGG